MFIVFLLFSGECTNKRRKPSVDGRLCKSFLVLNLRKSCFVSRLYLYVFISRNHLPIRFWFFIVIVSPNHKKTAFETHFVLENTFSFKNLYWIRNWGKSRNSETTRAPNVARGLCYGTRGSVTDTTPQKLVLHCAGTISLSSICRFCWPRTVVTGWEEAHFGLRSSV